MVPAGFTYISVIQEGFLVGGQKQALIKSIIFPFSPGAQRVPGGSRPSLWISKDSMGTWNPLNSTPEYKIKVFIRLGLHTG